MVNGVPKLNDFGSSKVLNKKNSPYIVARTYRAPELIMGLEYNLSIDIWAVGVMLFEFLALKIPFDGRTEGYQLIKIFENLGSPNPSLQKNVYKPQEIPLELYKLLLNFKRKPIFLQKIKSLDPQNGEVLLDLLLKMWDLDPNNRISADNAYNHAYFNN